VTPADPGDLTHTLQQPQPSELSTDTGQSFQPAGTPHYNEPASDAPRRNEVNESLREEFAILGRQMDGLYAQKATLKEAISVKDKELANLRATQESLSRDRRTGGGSGRGTGKAANRRTGGGSCEALSRDASNRGIGKICNGGTGEGGVRKLLKGKGRKREIQSKEARLEI